MRYFIVTGTSRGIGAALAAKLVSPGHRLFCISRSSDERLAGLDGVRHYACDLSRTDKLEELAAAVFEQIDASKAKAIYLINNAARIDPLGAIDSHRPEQIAESFQLNLLAPVILTSLFARYTKNWPIVKRVLNISSASARYVVPGMSSYSAVKAGLDMFAKCIAAEQTADSHPLKIASVWPGTVDTGLQEQARTADPNVFASAVLFQQLSQKDMLATPEHTVGKIVRLLLDDSFAHGEIIESL